MIKKTIILAFILSTVFLLCYVGNNFAENNGNKVIVYYFHGDFRCSNCINFEKYTKETLDTVFKDEIAQGKIVFEVINTDEKDNEHYMNDYGLYTKSVVLSLVKEGKQVKYKNLEGIWQNVRDKQKFMDYISGEIKSFLAEV